MEKMPTLYSMACNLRLLDAVFPLVVIRTKTILSEGGGGVFLYSFFALPTIFHIISVIPDEFLKVHGGYIAPHSTPSR
jgi:hypothetical protein